jgi:hypothetical protein
MRACRPATTVVRLLSEISDELDGRASTEATSAEARVRSAGERRWRAHAPSHGSSATLSGIGVVPARPLCPSAFFGVTDSPPT